VLVDVEADLAFHQLKTTMVSVPVLASPFFFFKPFQLETDASGKGVRAVLMQEGCPIAFMSQKLTLTAQGKFVYEKELMAIGFSIQKWWHYLLGKKFTVFTDQKSLKFLLEQRVVEEGQHKWLSKLMGYSFDIKYKVGLENRVADAVSRKFHFSSISFSVQLNGMRLKVKFWKMPN